MDPFENPSIIDSVLQRVAASLGDLTQGKLGLSKVIILGMSVFILNGPLVS